MNVSTRLGSLTLAVALVLNAPAAIAAPASAAPGETPASPPNAVTHWNRIAIAALLAFPPPAGAPPALQIDMAMVQGAVYDAINSIEPKHAPYLLETRFGANASKEAAAATAAYRVLSTIVSTVPPRIAFPNRADLLGVLDAEYETSLAAIPEGQFKAEGIAAGEAAADAMIAARDNDGRYGPSPWKSNDSLGHWQPLLNSDGTQMLDPTPWAGTVRPFLIESSSQFRTDGPLVLTSAAWTADFDEVKALGKEDNTTRTAEQAHIALWWQSNGGPAVMWNEVARDLVENPEHGIELDDSALLFAKLNLAGADAVISCWTDKYYWDF
jgi:hypothetical protein